MTALLLSLLLAVVPAQPSRAAVTIAEGWLRAAQPGQVTGGYAKFANATDTAAVITGVQSPVAKTIELHNMIERDGVMKMERVPRLTVPARGTLELAPGGYHLMLFDVTRPLAAGDRVTLTFVLEGGRQIEATFEVRRRDA